MTEDAVFPVHPLEHEGRSVLAIDTGLTPELFARAKLTSLLSEESWRVASDGHVSLWKPEGALERDGHIYLWGDFFGGVPLSALINEREEVACAALFRWIQARNALSPEQRARQRPVPAAALIADDGSVLLLGTQLVTRALDRMGAGARLERAERWLQPDLEGEDLESFTRAALAYRILTGKPPYTAKDPEALKREMRDGAFLGIRLCRFELRPEIAAAIDAALAPAATSARKNLRPTPVQLADFLCIASGSLFRPLAPEEQEALEREREAVARKQALIAESRSFWRRHRVKIITASIAAIVIGLVTLSLIQNALRQPTTRGMTPLQVVQTYYNSFGRLDHIVMQSCVREKAGKEDIEVATNLFVIGKMREAYAQNKAAFPADEWIKAGKPNTQAIIYGVTDLSIAEETQESTGSRTFDAKYTLWYPDYDSADVQGPTGEKKLGARVLSVGREDFLRLTEKKGLWHIVRIERKELK